MTRSVIESVLDVEPVAGVAVSISADLEPSVAAVASLLVDVDALGPKVEQLSVISSTPESWTSVSEPPPLLLRMMAL